MVTELTADNFDAEVNKSAIPVIIDFWASWCGPCMMMAPVFEELSKDYAGKLKFAKLSTEEHPEYAGNFSITGIPCLLVTKAGKEVDRIVGFRPKPMLKQDIENVLKKVK